MALFLTFEGPEGSGKSTQIRLLHGWLCQLGHAVVCTREPGGTPIGEQIRQVLHDHANTAMLSTTEILLYSAARAQHVGALIRPALARGDVVMSDRFAESTLAYQGYGRGLDLEVLARITHFATGGLRPDLIIYLDLDVAVGLRRKRRDQLDGRGEWNRMDQLDIDFHRRVREGYLRMAEEERHGGAGGSERWLLVDAAQSVEAIRDVIRARVGLLLSRPSGDAPQGDVTGGKGGSQVA